MNGQVNDTILSGYAQDVKVLIGIENVKRCSKCGAIKSINDFNKHPNAKGGLRPDCKSCVSVWKRGYRAKNREMLKEKDRAYALANPEKVSLTKSRWAAEHPDKIKETGRKFRENHPEHEKIRHKKYSSEHHERINENARKRYKLNPGPQIQAMLKWRRNNPDKYRDTYLKTGRKIRSTIEGKLNNMMGRGIWTAIKKKKRGLRWETFVDFSLAQLKKHLEKQFTEGMTWENQGTFWHVDHIIPRSVFKFKSPEDHDFKRCWALKNLRPLSATENLRKHNKLDRPFQPSLSFS
jgi:5-methylcytosine-specific restriction endonuclease McrA